MNIATHIGLGSDTREIADLQSRQSIEELIASINALKSDLSNQEITPIMPVTDSINIVEGGYTKIGNLCIVNFRFNKNYASTSAGTIARHLPRPISTTGEDYIAATVQDITSRGQSDYCGYGYIDILGQAFAKAPNPDNDYIFSAVYICE